MPLPMFKPPEEQPKRTANRIAHTVAIAAGKGGVGKSSITANLAMALQRAGYSVGVMDTDIYGPSIRQMLPEEQMPEQIGEMLVPAISKGIKVISMAYFRQPGEATAVRAPIANGMVTQFIKNVAWGNLDYLLIDFPPGTGDIQLTLTQQANLTGAIMVTTPQEVALMDVRKAANLFHQVNVPILGVIENMSYYQPTPSSERVYIFGKGGGKHLALEIGAPFLGSIPIDPEICQCSDNGKSLFLDQPVQPPAAQAFIDVAQQVVAHVTTLNRISKECLSSFNLIWKEMP